jgi:anti-sigma-K factor RskA
VNEYRDAATALPLSLDPSAPRPETRARLLEGLSGRAPRSAPVFTRVFWAAAALVLFALLFRSVPSEMRDLSIVHTQDAPAAGGMVRCADRSIDFSIAGLPALPEGKCYQLWHIGPDRIAVAHRTFHLDSSGMLRGSDALKHGPARDDLYAFTMEPEGGSRQPTMPIYAFAKY